MSKAKKKMPNQGKMKGCSCVMAFIVVDWSHLVEGMIDSGGQLITFIVLF